MLIKRIRIEHFRSIRQADIELNETTILIGPNNAGKSAILDAVRIALTRRWGHIYEAFRRDQQQQASPKPRLDVTPRPLV